MSEPQIHPENNDNQSVISEEDNEEDVDVFGHVEEMYWYFDFSEKFPILTKILESTWFSVLVNLLTIYALFGDDVRIIAFDKRADDAFDIITIICIVKNLSKVDYLFSRNINGKFSKKWLFQFLFFLVGYNINSFIDSWYNNF